MPLRSHWGRQERLRQHDCNLMHSLYSMLILLVPEAATRLDSAECQVWHCFSVSINSFATLHLLLCASNVWSFAALKRQFEIESTHLVSTQSSILLKCMAIAKLLTQVPPRTLVWCTRFYLCQIYNVTVWVDVITCLLQGHDSFSLVIFFPTVSTPPVDRLRVFSSIRILSQTFCRHADGILIWFDI